MYAKNIRLSAMSKQNEARRLNTLEQMGYNALQNRKKCRNWPKNLESKGARLPLNAVNSHPFKSKACSLNLNQSKSTDYQWNLTDSNS